MNITLVLAVYNNLKLTKSFYETFREIYPHAPLSISSAGSTDGTHDWLESLNDENLAYICESVRLPFSDNFNRAINLVKTDKLVLAHNDMVVGRNFLENLDKLLEEKLFLSYLTVEPPIFSGHRRAGKIIMDLGYDFQTFNKDLFNFYVNQNKDNNVLYTGASFFMSGYKKSFIDVGLFDGKTFNPAFCEDDDFLLRAKLLNYNLATTESAIVYHFVSQTSRFGDDFKNTTSTHELNSNRNFIRKWGFPQFALSKIDYFNISDFKYEKTSMGLSIKNINENILSHLEPMFDKIECYNLMLQSIYVQKEQKNTCFNLSEKFGELKDCDIIVQINEQFTNDDFNNLLMLRLNVKNYNKGTYQIGNLLVKFNK